MQRKTLFPLKSISVPNSVCVLVEEPDYERRDGISYISDGQKLKGRPVRIMKAAELRNRDLLAKVAGETPGWVDFLCGIKKLQQLKSDSDDPVVLTDAYRLMAATLGFDPKGEASENFKSTLTGSLVHALAGLRVVFWRTRPDKRGDMRLLPGLFAPDLKTATAACWCLSPELRVCTNCDRIFMAKRPLQTAHSTACAEAHRISRFWERKRRGRVTK
jgi:hypothetical protein